jgi:hypothetical protein
LHKYIFYFILIAFCQFQNARGQTFTALDITIWRDTVSVQAGETFINRVTLRNNGPVALSVAISMVLPSVIRLISTLPPQVSIRPGESVLLPIKGVLSHQSDSLTYRAVLSLSDSVSQRWQSVRFTVRVKQAWRPVVTLYGSDESVLLHSGTEPAVLPLRLVHNRLSRSAFRIDVASMPEGVSQSDFPRLVTLTGQQDTTLLVRCIPSRYWSVNTPYQLTITVRDALGSVVGNVLYKVVVASSSKRFSREMSNSGSPYGVSTAVGQYGDQQWFHETQAWGSDSLGKNQVDFRLHYMNFGKEQIPQLQNSFVSLRNEHLMVRVGSLYDYHEMPLLGRGVKVNIIRPDNQWTFWAVNSNPNWLNTQATTWAGNVLSVRYDKQIASLPGASWSASSSYFTNSFSQRLGFLNFASFQFSSKGGHNLAVLGGQSVEFARQGGSQTYGWAGQLNYSYSSPKVDWIVRTYWSSPVYSGFQKGAQLIDNRLIYKPSESTTLIVRYSQVQYDQHWFYSATEWNRRFFGNTQAELNLTHRLNKWTLGLRPYWYAQTNITSADNQQANLYRIAPFVLFRDKGTHRLEISYDIGTYQDSSPGAAGSVFTSQRMMGALGIGSFALWAYWQRGPYFLGDLQPRQTTKTTTASVTPTIDYTLLSMRLYGTLGLNYLYDTYSSGSRAQLISRIRYDVTPDLTIRAEGNVTAFSQLEQLAYSQYRLELVKRFGTLSLRKRGSIRLRFFDDANGNGVRETSEHGMDSLLVSINGNTLLSNRKGEIVYRNLAPGTYTVSTVSVNGLGEPVPYRESIVVNGRFQKQIPLSRMFRVSGKLTSRSHMYDRQLLQTERFMLEVQHNEQTVLQCAPLPDGSFGLPLRPGVYKLFIYDLGRQPADVVRTVPFTLTTQGQHPPLQIVVDATNRPVEIKRFSRKRD